MRQHITLLTGILIATSSLLSACGGGGQSSGSSSSSSSSSGGVKEHAFFIGSTAPTKKFRSDYAEAWQLIATQFQGTWGEVEGTRGTYKWQTMDDFYNFARNNKILFHYSSLISGAQQPNWSNNLDPEQTKLEIEDWVSQLCSRYKDADFITVVNEPSPGHQPARHAQKAFGDDWIIKSFELARKYCPNSMLLVNEYELFSKPFDDFVRLISPAVNLGLIDGIGIEGGDLRGVPAASITAVLNDIGNRFQLPIYITDLIVAGSDDVQLAQMQEQFPALYNHPKVRGITFASDLENETWFSNSGLFYQDHTPRPAMQWVQDYVKAHPKN